MGNILIDWLVGKKAVKPVEAPPLKKTARVNPGRTSSPTKGADPTNIVAGLDKQYKVINRQFTKEVIPLIRKLIMFNPDMGQALHNIISLGNTGHKIFFDRTVSTEQVEAMRNHIVNRQKEWASGQADMNGVVNKLFAQVMIGGALSGEWVPSNTLDGIESMILVNPEDIVCTLGKGKIKYDFYQEVDGLLGSNKDNLIKLNPETYKYFALNGDTEIPYGFPPYMAALNKVKTQQTMDENIEFVVDQLGLTGFLEVLLQKPDQRSGVNDPAYNAELENLLTEAKQRVKNGFHDGVIVGFDGDHKFNFNSIAQDFGKAIELYKNNELQLASGLKQDAALWGRDYGTSETQITVVFMKMLSELKNIQNIVAQFLKFGYTLDLKLAGFDFKYMTIVFNRSTIQDDLKYQQAEEIKVRNVKDKMLLGIIDQEQAADELGYETPAFDEPKVAWEVIAGGSDPAAAGLATDGEKKSQDRKKGKKESEKKSKEKSKP